jgi:hypothetical protein
MGLCVDHDFARRTVRVHHCREGRGGVHEAFLLCRFAVGMTLLLSSAFLRIPK